MAWIESHTVLLRHRKLRQLAKDLDIKPVHLMGHLHALWYAVLEQQEDGDLSTWSDELISECSEFSGDPTLWVNLLQKHGWLDGKMIHDWLDYAGRYLNGKYRTSNPKRLKSIYGKHKTVYSRTKDRPIVGLKTDNLPNLPNHTKPTLPNQPTNPYNPLSENWFSQLWENYPRREGRRVAQKHFQASVKTEADFQACARALENYKAVLAAEETPAKFIKHGSTFFNNWRDYEHFDIRANAVPGHGSAHVPGKYDGIKGGGEAARMVALAEELGENLSKVPEN